MTRRSNQSIRSAVIDQHIRSHKDANRPSDNPDLGDMTPEQEDQWRRDLVNYNMKFALGEVGKFSRFGLPTDDLVQESMMGMVEAARRFDPSQGNKFISYAIWWCRAYMQEYQAEMGFPVSFPRWMGTHGSLFGDINEKERASEIDARAIVDALKNADSLEKTLVSGSRETLKDFIPDEEQETAIEVAMRHMLGARIGEYISALPGRHGKIIVRRFGLDGMEPQSYESIARDLGLSRERVRQLAEEAMDCVRRNPYHMFDGLWECASHMDGVSNDAPEAKSKKPNNSALRWIVGDRRWAVYNDGSQ